MIKVTVGELTTTRCGIMGYLEFSSSTSLDEYKSLGGMYFQATDDIDKCTCGACKLTLVRLDRDE